MKCKICKKRMQPTLASYDLILDGRKMKVINAPAEQCPECGSIEVFDLVQENAKRYADICKGSIIDYQICEEEENANLITTQMLLWL
jgi:YgiT-type zinc finger domain-containing protein